MKSFNLQILVLILLLTSCQGKQRKGFQETIEIDLEQLNRMPLSQFVSDVTVIPLETNNQTIIGQISKIQIFNNQLYILDELSNSIMIFDKNGKFIKKLNKIGQGPGEYIRLKDFEVNENGLYILDISGRKINHYDTNLNFITKTNLESISSYFTINDNFYWLYNEPNLSSNYYQLTKIDQHGKVSVKDFQKKASADSHEYNWSSSHVFQKNNTEFYFSPPYSNSIYIEKGDDWLNAFTFSFGKKTFPKNKNINDYNIADDDFPFIIRENFYCSEKYLIIDFLFKNKCQFAFFDKESKKVHSGVINNDLISEYDRFFPRFLTGNCFIEIVDAEYILTDFQGLIPFNKNLEKLQEDDNPILVLYSLKRS